MRIVKTSKLLLPFVFLIVFVVILGMSLTPARAAKQLDLRKLHSKENHALGDTLNITFSIKNISDRKLMNITFTDEYDNKTFKILSSANITETYNLNDTVSYHWDELDIGESVFFWTYLEIVSNKTEEVAIAGTKVYFQYENGIQFYEQSNALTIKLLNPEILTSETTLLYPRGSEDYEIPVGIAIVFLPILAIILTVLIVKRK